MKNEIQRYNVNKRSNHWAAAILLLVVELFRLILFHPALFRPTSLFDGSP